MFDSMWRSLIDTLAGLVPDISPFWFEWLPFGLLIVAAACVAGWFFPILRSLAGAVVVGVVAFLYGYRKGEGEYAARHKPKPKPKLPGNEWEWRW